MKVAVRIPGGWIAGVTALACGATLCACGDGLPSGTSLTVHGKTAVFSCATYHFRLRFDRSVLRCVVTADGQSTPPTITWEGYPRSGVERTPSGPSGLTSGVVVTAIDVPPSERFLQADRHEQEALASSIANVTIGGVRGFRAVVKTNGRWVRLYYHLAARRSHFILLVNFRKDQEATVGRAMMAVVRSFRVSPDIK